MTEVQLIYTAAEIRDLEAERDSQRDRADSKQRGWDEANRQLDAMAAKLAEMEQRYQSLDAGAGALKAERDSLKAKLAETERDRDARKRRAEQHGCNIVEGDHECG